MIIDILFLIIIIVLAIIGLKNGFIIEIFNLIKIFATIYLIPYFGKMINSFYPIELKFENQKYLLYIILFIITYIIINLIASLFSKLLNNSPLNFINRLLGLIFGILKSTIIIFIIYIILLFSSEISGSVREALLDSKSVSYISIYLSMYNNLFPNIIRDKLMKFEELNREKQFRKDIIRKIENEEKYD